MTGREAWDFVVEEIKKHVAKPNGQKHNAMNISRDLAYDSCKVGGPLTEQTGVHSIDALREHNLFGYVVDVDLAKDGNVVEFGVA